MKNILEKILKSKGLSNKAKKFMIIEGHYKIVGNKELTLHTTEDQPILIVEVDTYEQTLQYKSTKKGRVRNNGIDYSYRKEKYLFLTKEEQQEAYHNFKRILEKKTAKNTVKV